MAGFDELFGDDYLYFWEQVLPDELSDRQKELIWGCSSSSRGWRCSTSRAGTGDSRTGWPSEACG